MRDRRTEDFIQQLKARLTRTEAKLSKWISVKERLPTGDEGGWCKVLVDDVIVSDAFYSGGDGNPWMQDLYWGASVENVTHWLLVIVPSPPQEQHVPADPGGFASFDKDEE